MRPSRLIALSYLRRSAVIWLTMRLVVSAVFAFAATNPFDIRPSVAAGLVGVSVGLLFADIGLRHEETLIGNLAVSNAALAALAALPGIAGEAVLALIYTSVT